MTIILLGSLSELTRNGAVHMRTEATKFCVKKFHHRFRMSLNLFHKIYKDVIDKEIGSDFSNKHPIVSEGLGPRFYKRLL